MVLLLTGKHVFWPADQDARDVTSHGSDSNRRRRPVAVTYLGARMPALPH